LKKLMIDSEFKMLIPPLQAEEIKQLEENIIAEGCRDPLSVWDGVIVDGHNRYEICTKHDLGFDVHEVAFEDRSHAIEWIIRNQFGRRNLAAFDRVNLALQLDSVLEARYKDKYKETVGRPSKEKLAELEKAAAEVREISTGFQKASAAIEVKNKLAEKSPPISPATKKRSQRSDRREDLGEIAGVSSNTVAKVKAINQAIKQGKVDQGTLNKIRTGDTSINRVVRDLKGSAAKERIEVIKAEAVKKLVAVDEIILGDFREKADQIPDNSVDLIFTDPPYDRAAIKLFDGLGEFANRVLRPGGSLVFYLGQIQLPEAIRILSTHLRYWWCCSCYHSGPTLLRMNEYGIVNGWKPMLWFVKETRGDKETFINDVATGTKEKSHHEWQQSESEALYFIEKLTKPGDLVVDPFCGGGTTPAVCEKVNRKWLAFEIDSANYARSCERIISLRGV
jgi:hypothetical protein